MIHLTRPLTRKVVTAYGKPLVITLAPEGIWAREPRRRVRFLTPYGVCFQRAVQDEIDAKRREKAKAKKAKKKAKARK